MFLEEMSVSGDGLKIGQETERTQKWLNHSQTKSLENANFGTLVDQHASP